MQADIARFEVRGQAAALITPKQRTSKVVVYMHGAGERIESAFRDVAKDGTFKALLDAGYALAATDAHGDNWGNPASVQDQLALVAELRERGLPTSTSSRCRWAASTAFRCSAAFRSRRGRASSRPAIWPPCGTSACTAARSARPTASARAHRRAARCAVAARWRSIRREGLPMRFWASPGDRVIPTRPNTAACAAIARRRGARVEVTTTRGDHGHISNYDPAGVLRAVRVGA